MNKIGERARGRGLAEGAAGLWAPAGAVVGGLRRAGRWLAAPAGVHPCRGESQAAWEAFLWNLHERGLAGGQLQMVISDGCAGVAAAIETIYPRARHQRCWVHKMRNLRDGVRRRDQAQVKRDAQRIYLARNAVQARRAFQRFRFHWQAFYPGWVKRLECDLPELLTFFDFPQPLWRKLRTTNAIGRCFVEVRGRTRPMVVFVNVASMERIIYAIFQHFNH